MRDMRLVTEPYPTLYKITGPKGECVHGGSGDWSLPTRTRPGAWREIPASESIVACARGLHLASAERLTGWYQHGRRWRVWRVEIDGELWDAGEKYVARRVRLLPSVMPKGSGAVRKHRAAQRRADALLARADRLRRRIPRAWQAYGGVAPTGIDPACDAHARAVSEYRAAQRDADKLLRAAQRASLVPAAPR